MSAKSFLRGHEIEWDEGQDAFVYFDTREPTIGTHKNRPCGHCGRHATPEGHDACLGTLPGIMNACCGHGQTQDAYVQFWDGRRMGGDVAVAYFETLTRRKDESYIGSNN